jgi:hypothetical protein
MARGRWITPDAPGDVTVSRCISVPINLLPALGGALDLLAESRNWEQIGTMSADDVADAFRVIIDAFYESEDCMAIAAPLEELVFWNQGIVLAGNALQTNLSASQAFGTFWRQNYAAINDERRFRVFLDEGDYNLTICAVKDTASGILTTQIGDVADDQTIDLYAAGQIFNFEATITVTIPSSGIHMIDFKVASKNASSSNYRANVTYFRMARVIE